jgi:putative flippase GtrA
LAVAQTWMISFGLVEFVFPGFSLINYSQEIAHAIGITVPVLTSYFGHKYWTFKH